MNNIDNGNENCIDSIRRRAILNAKKSNFTSICDRINKKVKLSNTIDTPVATLNMHVIQQREMERNTRENKDTKEENATHI